MLFGVWELYFIKALEGSLKLAKGFNLGIFPGVFGFIYKRESVASSFYETGG